MITFLQGTIVEKEPTRIVLDVGGVGYEVFIPLSSFDRLPAKDAACRVLTVDYIREDAHQLFGFMTDAERKMFHQLTSVTGIGPRTALSALSGLSVRDIRAAVVSNDIRRLSSISGIGKKTAERIVVELKDKIGAAEALEALAGTQAGKADDELSIRDAVLALAALGYRQEEARKLVQHALDHGAAVGNTEEIIRKALAGR
jgi:holliday junction DNA helicase RuvA